MSVVDRMKVFYHGRLDLIFLPMYVFLGGLGCIDLVLDYLGYNSGIQYADSMMLIMMAIIIHQMVRAHTVSWSFVITEKEYLFHIPTHEYAIVGSSVFFSMATFFGAVLAVSGQMPTPFLWSPVIVLSVIWIVYLVRVQILNGRINSVSLDSTKRRIYKNAYRFYLVIEADDNGLIVINGDLPFPRWYEKFRKNIIQIDPDLVFVGSDESLDCSGLPVPCFSLVPVESVWKTKRAIN